jgi:glycosyltransferase involved in cell wall biosynthesis
MTDHAKLPKAYGKKLAWWGEVTEETGYAQEGRLLLKAIDRAGFASKIIPLSAKKIVTDIKQPYQDKLKKYLNVELPPDRISILHWGGTEWWPEKNKAPTIWRTMFETSSLPQDWVKQSLKADEVWVPSQFNVDTFTYAGVPEEKIRILHEPIDTGLFDPDVVTPIEQLNRDTFSFLSVFTWQERKGWDVLLKAYNQAFSMKDDVTLVLHINNFLSVNFEPHKAVVEAAANSGKGNKAPRVVITDLSLSESEMPALYAASDAFVLPSRGEGWGRPYFEAMCMGLPTIGTGWGGNTEYMKKDNSFLLEYDICNISSYAAAEWHYYDDHQWAEPSLDHLITTMREVFDNYDHAKELGDKAKVDIRESYSIEHISEQLNSQ